MRCPQAVRTMIEREIGLLDRAGERRLVEHLAGCAACASRLTEERLLTRELSRLGAAPPPPVDVVASVMARLGRLGPVERSEVPDRQLAWAAAACVLWGLLLTGALAWRLPDVARAARGAGRLAASLVGLVGELVRAIVSLLAVPFRIAGSLIESVSGLLGLAGTLEPFAIGAIAAGYAAVALTVVIVVSRDLVAPVGFDARGKLP